MCPYVSIFSIEVKQSQLRKKKKRDNLVTNSLYCEHELVKGNLSKRFGTLKPPYRSLCPILLCDGLVHHITWRNFYCHSKTNKLYSPCPSFSLVPAWSSI
ncbi:hypothetical protein GDO81_018593 [Engystomops pustulosus]|uniref:Uncharacterized protein n=1 Tax=Engystomops pustulosus TaxID=76066 RepID=A0AAV6ZK49_ENGPU|nr:hypothetical protein GDO81_018593 [Engystomops pustulosus]